MDITIRNCSTPTPRPYSHVGPGRCIVGHRHPLSGAAIWRKPMRKLVLAAALLALSIPICAVADDHVAVQADGVKWGAAPPAFPPGAQFAVVSGDPSKEA